MISHSKATVAHKAHAANKWQLQHTIKTCDKQITIAAGNKTAAAKKEKVAAKKFSGCYRKLIKLLQQTNEAVTTNKYHSGSGCCTKLVKLLQQTNEKIMRAHRT